MLNGPLHRFIQSLRQPPGGAVERPGDADLELLLRFSFRRDEEAFAQLVRRHGPMVLGVCRRVLNNDHDAEDAFQATFLVLARRARSIRSSEAIGSWLYKVAYRIAVRARAGAARRQALEAQAGNMAEDNPIDEITWRELRPVLDEELDRLPAKYRAPVVLCYLEGKTNTEAARELGWTKGTVSGRLARARDLLRQRLSRRGIALTSALLATLLPESARAAGVPESLLAATVSAVAHAPASLAFPVGVVSERVVSLAAGGLQATAPVTFTNLAQVALVFGMVLTGGGLVAYPYLEGDTPGGTQGAAPSLLSPLQAAGLPAANGPLVQGEWRLIARVRGGQKAKAEDLDGLHVFFKGDNLLIQSPVGDQAFRFRVGGTTDPRQIDLIQDDQVWPGIVWWERDLLKICLAEPGHKRPTEFTSPLGSDDTLVILRCGQRGARAM